MPQRGRAQAREMPLALFRGEAGTRIVRVGLQGGGRIDFLGSFAGCVHGVFQEVGGTGFV